MPTSSVFLHHLRATPGGLSVAQLLALQPGVARRSAQRLLADMVAPGLIEPVGEGLGRHYRACALQACAVSPFFLRPRCKKVWRSCCRGK